MLWIFSLKVSCVYDIDTNQAVAFNTRPRRSEPYAENSKGQLQVVMRLAMGKTQQFYYCWLFTASIKSKGQLVQTFDEILYHEIGR